MADLVIVAHKGIPCTPPIVDGVEFFPLGEDDIYVAECSEETAAHITRIPAFVRYGGGLPFPGSTAAAEAVKTAEEAQALLDKAAAEELERVNAETAEAEAVAARAAADEQARLDAEAASSPKKGFFGK